MGTKSPCFSAIFTKGNNFCEFFFFLFLDDNALPNRNLLLKERIHSTIGWSRLSGSVSFTFLMPTVPAPSLQCSSSNFFMYGHEEKKTVNWQFKLI